MVVVDTPVFENSSDEMEKMFEEMVNVLNNDVETADAILLTIDQGNPMITTGLEKMLHKLESVFGKRMWKNTMIEIR